MITAILLTAACALLLALLCVGAALWRKLEDQIDMLRSMEQQRQEPAVSGERRYVSGIDVFCTSDGGVAVELADAHVRLYTHLSPDKADELAGLLVERARLQREPEGVRPS